MKRLTLIFFAVAALASCSTVKVLKEGQYRLAMNTINVTNKEMKASELYPYLVQPANKNLIGGWNPLISIYNWSDGSGSKISKAWEKIGEAPVVFKEDLVPSSEKNLLSHLNYRGYYKSLVTSKINYKKRLAFVNYNVTPAGKIRIAKITYSVPGGQFAQEFEADKKNSLIQPGTFLSTDLLEREATRGVEVFRNKGYYDFSPENYSFVADTVTEEGKAYLEYKIAGPANKYRFGDVKITHGDKFPVRESVLTSLNNIFPSDTFSNNVVNETYYRLSSLRLFNSVNVDLKRANDSIVDCNIKLAESGMSGFTVNLEASTSSNGLIGISPKFNYYHKNIFHGGERLDLSLSGLFQFKPKDKTTANEFGISGNLSLPGVFFINNRKFKGLYVPRTEIGLSFNYQNRPEYVRSGINATFGMSGRTMEKFYYRINPIQIGYVKLSRISESFQKTLDKNPLLKYSYQTHFDLGIGLQAQNTDAKSAGTKEPYHFEYYMLETSGNLLNLIKVKSIPYSQYVRGEISASRGFSLGKNNNATFAVRGVLGAGYAYGNSMAMPFEKQFYVGGASSMRAWQVRTLGPADSKPSTGFVIPSQTGDFKMEVDMELRYSMFWKFEGALFAEVGNVYNFRDFRFNTFYKSLGADWGVGLRLNMDIIVIRLDFGMKMHDPTRDVGARWLKPKEWFQANGNAFQFGVGYPF